MHPKARKTREEGRDRSAIAAAGGFAARSPAKTFEVLVAEARTRLDELDAGGAAALFERALEQRPDDVETLDALGEICFSEGDVDRAREVFTRGAELRPSEVSPVGAARWLYLGQLDEGRGAADKFLRGTALLRQYLLESPAGGDDPERRSCARDLSGAFCSLAELFMTDLCDEDGAEARCDEYAAAAVAADAGNPEAYRVLADLRMCQSRPKEALEPILRAIELLEASYPPDEGEEEGEGAEAAAPVAPPQRRKSAAGPSMAAAAAAAAAATAAGDAHAAASARAALEFAALAKLSQLPPWESRLRAAQIAMELQAYAPAVGVLVRLLEEDDAAMEVWFLLAEAHLHLGDFALAREYVEDARETVAAALAVASKARGGGAAKHRKRGALGAVALLAAGGGGAGGASAELVALGRAELEAQLAKFQELAAAIEAAAAAAGGAAAAPADDDMSGARA